MKILHVITSLQQGGAEEMLYKTLEFHKIVGGDTADILVLCLSSRGIVGDKIEAFGFRVIYLNLKNIKRFLPHFFKRMRVIKKFKPEVVHCWMYHANIFSLLLKLFITKVKIIWGVRQSLCDIRHEKRATRWVIKLSRVLSRFSSIIIYNSVN